MKTRNDLQFTLFTEVRDFIAEHRLFHAEHKLLLAFSSGPDSVFLAEFLRNSGYDFEIAHFNYAKRASESDKDEEFAHLYADKYKIRIHSRNAREEVQYIEGNFQHWAREVRYSWFDSLVEEHEFDRVLTAHHLDDQLENFIMTLVRGSGLKGLKAMLPLRDQVARPLLSLNKAKILEYLDASQIPYRVDHSNFEDIYLRNRVRKLIPDLTGIDDSFYDNFKVTLKILQSQWQALEECAEEIKWEIGTEYNLEDCLKRAIVSQSLFNWMDGIGFSRDQFFSLKRLLGSTEYKVFESETYELRYQRGVFRLIETTKSNTSLETYHCSSDIIGMHNLDANYLEICNADQAHFGPDGNIEYINAELISSGFSLRVWRAGDRMKPIGMNGYEKKISDLLTDYKLPKEEKETQLVLCDLEDRIIWLVGLRLSEIARVKEGAAIIKLRFEEK